MRRRSSRTICRGYTLVEAMVAVFFVTVALTAAMGGIRALALTDARARRVELLQRLAYVKISTMGAVTNVETAETEGDFADVGYPDVQWTVEVETTATTSINLVRVTATMDDLTQTLTTLVYVRPVTAGTLQ